MTVAACTSGASVLDGSLDASSCDAKASSAPDATNALGCLDVLAGDGGLLSTGGTPGSATETGGTGTGGARGTGGEPGTGAFGFGGAGATQGTGGVIGPGTGGFLLTPAPTS